MENGSCASLDTSERPSYQGEAGQRGYATMLSLVQELQPAFAPGVVCYT